MHNDRAGTVERNQGSSSASPEASDKQIVIERLGNHHRIAEFICCESAKSTRVQDFLHRQALTYERKNFARIFVLSPPEDPGRVLGFYSLSAAIMSCREISRSQQRNGPGNIDFPMVKLGYMGRSNQAKDFGKLGSIMIYDAATRVSKIDAIGVWGIILDAEIGDSQDPPNDKLVTWYAKQGFLPLNVQQPNSGTYTMFASLSSLLPSEEHTA